MENFVVFENENEEYSKQDNFNDILSNTKKTIEITDELLIEYYNSPYLFFEKREFLLPLEFKINLIDFIGVFVLRASIDSNLFSLSLGKEGKSLCLLMKKLSFFNDFKEIFSKYIGNMYNIDCNNFNEFDSNLNSSLLELMATPSMSDNFDLCEKIIIYIIYLGFSDSDLSSGQIGPNGHRANSLVIDILSNINFYNYITTTCSGLASRLGVYV